MSSTSGDTTPLEADFAALRKLRDTRGESTAASDIIGNAASTPAPPVAQGQDISVNEALVNALANAKGGTTTTGTCNNATCYCAIA